MTNPKFSSVLSSYLQAYRKECLLVRRSMQTVDCDLVSFDRFLVKENVIDIHISNDLFEKWVKSWKDNCTPATIYERRSRIISLLKYMNEVGVVCDVPRIGKCPQQQFIPCIISEEEMAHLFQVCDSWRDRCMKPESALMVMPILLRLLYSTGLRISEALNIRNKDVDFKQRTIRIEKTKNDCERIAPINDSLLNCMIQYLRFRDKLPYDGLDKDDSYFLVNHKGRKLSQQTVLIRFHQMTAKAGIKSHYSKGGVRIHDIRHTACVHVMLKLTREGYDLYNCLPAISAFMGHLSLFSTEQYLRFTQEMFPEMLEMTQSVSHPITAIIDHAYNFADDE